MEEDKWPAWLIGDGTLQASLQRPRHNKSPSASTRRSLNHFYNNLYSSVLYWRQIGLRKTCRCHRGFVRSAFIMFIRIRLLLLRSDLDLLSLLFAVLEVFVYWILAGGLSETSILHCCKHGFQCQLHTNLFIYFQICIHTFFKYNYKKQS